MAKTPRKLKIGTQIYKIKMVDDLKDDEGNLWGQAIHGQRLVKIDKQNCRDQQRQTLLHEVIHIIGVQSGQDFKEEQIDALAYGLIDAMRSNDWFKEYFGK